MPVSSSTIPMIAVRNISVSFFTQSCAFASVKISSTPLPVSVKHVEVIEISSYFLGREHGSIYVEVVPVGHEVRGQGRELDGFCKGKLHVDALPGFRYVAFQRRDS